MQSGDQYRNRANECIAAADKATEPERKVSFLELAQRWLRLAFHTNKIQDRNADALCKGSGRQLNRGTGRESRRFVAAMRNGWYWGGIPGLPR